MTGDFNGDGAPDLAVGAEEGLYVLLNDGGGRFLAALHSDASPAFWLERGADLNGDGLDDLIGSSTVYLSRGDGTFQPGRYIGSQEAVGMGDFNGDQTVDLVLAGYQGGVRIFRGNGDGTFQEGAEITSARALQVRVADFNNDGTDDVAAIVYDPGAAPRQDSLLVFLAQAGGAFGSAIPTEVEAPIVVADFNNDGLPDILQGGYRSGGAPTLVALGNGDGSFQSPASPFISAPAGNWSTAADFTGDGFVDLIMSEPPSSRLVRLYPGKGDGTLLAPIELDPTGDYGGIPVDLDEDGHADLAVARDNRISIRLFRETSQPVMRRAISAAENLAVVSPDSLATLYAPAPVAASEAAEPPWPTSLAGIRLEVRDSAGETFFAPLLFASGTQINFRTPAGVALGDATLSIVNGTESAIAGSMQVQPVAPSLFSYFTGVMVEADGSEVPVAQVVCDNTWGCYNTPIPVTARDRPIYLTFYGTGFRGASTENVTCRIIPSYHGLPAAQGLVLSAGESGTPGLEQITVQLPPEALQPPGDYGLRAIIRIDGVSANPAWIAVE